LAEFPGFVYRFVYNPDEQVCEESTARKLEFYADCTDLVGKPGTDLTATFEQVIDLDEFASNLNDIQFELEWEFWDEGSFSGDPGELEAGVCTVWGVLTIEQPSGITTVECNPVDICFNEVVYDENGGSHPELELVNTQLTTQSAGGGELTLPGVPLLSTYTIKNWTDQTFDGIFTIGSDNGNNTVAFEPSSSDETGYTYNLSEGEGDDFPVEIDPDDGTEFDACFPLPTPSTSESPTAALELKLPAGESRNIKVYSRSWGTCANGSCAGIASSIEGTFADGRSNKTCAGGIVIVDDEGGGGLGDCPDGGEPSGVVPCDGTEPPDDPCYEYERFQPGHEVAGLRLTGSGGMDIAVLLEGTESDAGSLTHETDTHNISSTHGRIQEDIFLAGGISAGTSVELVSSFKMQAGNAEGRGTVTELSIGDKYSPDETVAHSFIGLGEAVVAGIPNAMFQLHFQESIWAVDPASGHLVEIPIESGGYTVDGETYSVRIVFQVPESGAESYVLTHDMRAFALSEFEVDCADGADNDNDGLVDCEDDDCAQHPVCTEDTGEGDTDSGDSDVEDEAGCGCSSSTTPQSGLLMIAMATLLGWCRRRRSAA